ncbi:MAG TPA: hypothetical protein VFC46_02680 [Humisphaera sp.]|nr:hypothetical protein [Humisphaera sp.]
MHIRCYFHLRQGADGGWIATNDHPQLLAGAGKTAKDAVRDLQAKVLVAASESFGRESPVANHYFTNHADSRFR